MPDATEKPKMTPIYNSDRAGTTHWNGCWASGPRHYECALERISGLQKWADALFRLSEELNPKNDISSKPPTLLILEHIDCLKLELTLLKAKNSELTNKSTPGLQEEVGRLREALTESLEVMLSHDNSENNACDSCFYTTVCKAQSALAKDQK